MGIQLSSSFTVNAALPLDDRFSVASLAARDAIPAGRRWQGMQVFVVADTTTYILKTGILNTDWVASGSGSGSSSNGGADQVLVNISYTLTSASSRVFELVTSDQDIADSYVTLPDATTLTKGGPVFHFKNSANYRLFVRDFAGTMIAILSPKQSASVYCVANITPQGEWVTGNTSYESTALAQELITANPDLNGATNDFSNQSIIVKISNNTFVSIWTAANSKSYAQAFFFAGGLITQTSNTLQLSTFTFDSICAVPVDALLNLLIAGRNTSNLTFEYAILTLSFAPSFSITINSFASIGLSLSGSPTNIKLYKISTSQTKVLICYTVSSSTNLFVVPAVFNGVGYAISALGGTPLALATTSGVPTFTAKVVGLLSAEKVCIFYSLNPTQIGFVRISVTGLSITTLTSNTIPVTTSGNIVQFNQNSNTTDCLDLGIVVQTQTLALFFTVYNSAGFTTAINHLLIKFNQSTGVLILALNTQVISSGAYGGMCLFIAGRNNIILNYNSSNVAPIPITKKVFSYNNVSLVETLSGSSYPNHFGFPSVASIDNSLSIFQSPNGTSYNKLLRTTIETVKV